MPWGRRDWVNLKSGRVLTRAEEPRRERTKESRRARRERLRDEAKKRRVEEMLRNVRWSCRYLDNCKRCGCFSCGYCSKDGLRCEQVDRFRRRRVFGSFSNPFDALNWSELFEK
jgi:hypothetical protein